MSNPLATALLPPASQTLLAGVQDRLTEYVEKMAVARPISASDGAFQQSQLWRGVINQLLQQSPEVFNIGWAYFLSVVLTHREGCFSPAYFNRFRDNLKLTIDERRSFERLLHLAYITADPLSRQLALKQVDFNQILARLSNENQRQLLIGFYQKL